MRRVKTGAQLISAMDEGGDELKKDISKVLSKVSMDAFRMLVRRSAKDTGFLRSNWDVSVDRAPMDNVKHNPGGKFAAAISPKLNPKFNSVITLYNNTEYAIYLETGTPKMSAQPMIVPTAIAVNMQLRSAYKILSNKKYHV
jgi:HK97 gp10 family phage protein